MNQEFITGIVDAARLRQNQQWIVTAISEMSDRADGIFCRYAPDVIIMLADRMAQLEQEREQVLVELHQALGNARDEDEKNQARAFYDAIEIVERKNSNGN